MSDKEHTEGCWCGEWHDPEKFEAATPQVTPQLPKFEGILRDGSNLPMDIFAAQRQLNGGASEQASPTPDKCPKCDSPDRNKIGLRCLDSFNTDNADSWHSSAGTPKGNTGVSLDGGKTIHSKFKND